MTTIFSPRVLVAGTCSSVGKSLLSTGLAVALRKRGVSLSCCVTGQALHQALIYSRISRRYSRTLDRRMLNPDQVLLSLYQASLGADLILIDGTGGLYDGVVPTDLRGSDADVAAITKTPVVLVANLPEYSASVAALVKGYSRFVNEVTVGAVIGSRLPVPPQADPFSPNPVLSFLNECMNAYKLPPFIGGLPTATFPVPLPPAIFAQDENRTSLPMQFFLDVGSLVSNHVDIDQLVALAQTAPNVELPFDTPNPQNRRARFAVTDDSCFNVCFQDNLDLMRYFGSEMVTFSPLADTEIPRRVGGLYITGAYLHTYGEELSRNDQMRDSIREFAESGGVIYAEGAGTAYLCRSYQLERGGESYPGVGLIPADAFAAQQPRVFLNAVTYDHSVLGPPGFRLQGVSTGEWTLRGLIPGHGTKVEHALQIIVDGAAPINEGFAPTAQSCATFNFLHFGSNPAVARSLVEAASVKEKV
jgi:cobyrinic acid a,c-diamide synthase